MFHRSPFRVFTALAAASMLAACQGGATSPLAPAAAPGNATQSAARAVASHKTPAPEIAANPASLEFSAAQAAAGTPQIVTITAKDDGRLNVSIAGTGNCPTVSPAKLKAKKADEDGDRDRDGRDPRSGVITVTPNGAGPAACTITVTSAERDGDKDHHDNDKDRHDKDGDHHDSGITITIPVTVDAPPTPTPAPTCASGRGC